MRIKELLQTWETYEGQDKSVCGWVRTCRKQKHLLFIWITDGSCMEGIQGVFDNSEEKFKIPPTGASVGISGTVKKSPAKGQEVEIEGMTLCLLGDIPDPRSYPLAKTKLGLEFLRSYPHLRTRAKTFQAVFRIKNGLSAYFHSTLQKAGYLQIQTPILTEADCEGGSEVFQATTLLKDGPPPLTPDGKIDYEKDYCNN